MSIKKQEHQATHGNTIIEDNIYDLEYDFENLVMEGGGSKGMAYVGALKVLEKAGVAQKIKRICGASAGAMLASLFAIGYTAAQLQEFMETDLQSILIDHKCGFFSFLPNLLNGFGWNPGKKLLQWFGEQLKEATGNADITFKQVLEQYGRELCIVVTNLSQMNTDYCHAKTTPDMPIRLAVRMSSALPGVFQSVRHRNPDASKGDAGDVYVDGGLLCNYPIHAFDGWWLSMKPEDSFFRKFQPLNNYVHLFSQDQRFGAWNDKTIGVMLYSLTETELMKQRLSERLGEDVPAPPTSSKLYQKRHVIKENQEEATAEHNKIVDTMGKFMLEVQKQNYDADSKVDLNELTEILKSSSSFTLEDRQTLFGTDKIKDIFVGLDENKDGGISFLELVQYLERRGANVQQKFVGYAKKDIKSLGDFILTLQKNLPVKLINPQVKVTALSINVKRNYVKDRDTERTIGIDTDYIETTDFTLQEVDKKFLLESGACSARAFLRYYSKTYSNKVSPRKNVKYAENGNVRSEEIETPNDERAPLVSS